MPKTLVIDGAALAEEIRLGVRKEIVSKKLHPQLAVILVGEDAPSHLYVKLKEKASHEVGIVVHKYLVDGHTGTKALLEVIDFLNKDKETDAILVQLPLPPHLNEDEIIAAIDPAKDADGFHPANVKKLLSGKPYTVPGLAAGILKLIEDTKENLAGKSALILANSEVFATPLSKVLEGVGIKAKFLKPDAAGLAEHTRKADILVVAIGRANFIKGDMIKPGAIIIDVGTNKVHGATVGDVDAESVNEIAGFITPVPGGVGPMTVAMLLKTVVELNQ